MFATTTSLFFDKWPFCEFRPYIIAENSSGKRFLKLFLCFRENKIWKTVIHEYPRKYIP